MFYLYVWIHIYFSNYLLYFLFGFYTLFKVFYPYNSIVKDSGDYFCLSVDQLVSLLINFLNPTIHINFLNYHTRIYGVVRSVWIIIHIKLLKFIYYLDILWRWGCEEACGAGWACDRTSLHTQLAITICIQASGWRCELRSCWDWGPVIGICDQAVAINVVFRLISYRSLQKLTVTLSRIWTVLRWRARHWWGVESGPFVFDDFGDYSTLPQNILFLT